MYISRNSIVIKTNYETGRRGRGAARRRAGEQAREASASFVHSSDQLVGSVVQSRTTERQTRYL